MPPRSNNLLRTVRAELKRAADPRKAPQMQRYMKSEMPYHGVPVPLVRTICKPLFRDLALPNATTWSALVRELWHGATFREERYAALALTADRRAEPFQKPSVLPLYEELIVSGAWWDFVDEIATRRVGKLVADHRAPLTKKMLAWSRDRNLWKRRTAILCQLHAGGETDLEFLYACFEPSLDSKEFFLRKAIGWALRQYARTAPAEVRRYVREQGDRLSPLSRREALKHL